VRYRHRRTRPCALLALITTIALAAPVAANALTLEVSNAAALPAARYGAAATTLADGRVVVTGGYAGTFQATSWVYTPATNSWTTVAPMPANRAYHAMVTRTSGDVLVFGGRSASGESSTVFRYDPTANTWSTLAVTLPEARQSAGAVALPDGRVLVVGGTNGGGIPVNTARILNAAATNCGGVSCTRLTSGVPFCAGRTTAATETYDVSSNTWTPRATLGFTGIGLAALPSGAALAAGGTPSSSFAPSSQTSWAAPAAAAWTSGPSLGYTAWLTAAATLSDGRILVAGGANGSSTAQANVVILDPVIPRPVADTASVAAGQSVVVDVLANDANLRNAPNVLSVVSGPLTGTVAAEAGKLRYSAPVGATGTATIGYRVTDADGDPGEGVLTVTINAAAAVPAPPLLPPPDTTAPTLTNARASLTRRRLKITGTAADAGGLARIEVRILRRGRAGCASLVGRRLVAGVCATLKTAFPRTAVLASGGKWAESALLPRVGAYVIAVRAIDAAGNPSMPITRHVVAIPIRR
jgi:Bacterial Ig domain/Galactose oxidase, central domain